MAFYPCFDAFKSLQSYKEVEKKLKKKHDRFIKQPYHLKALRYKIQDLERHVRQKEMTLCHTVAIQIEETLKEISVK